MGFKRRLCPQTLIFTFFCHILKNYVNQDSTFLFTAARRWIEVTASHFRTILPSSRWDLCSFQGNIVDYFS